MRKIIKVMAIASLLTPALYGSGTVACKGCHGANFENVAMGKSKVVSEMSKADIIASMKGYKDGSYGGAMKGMMTGQVANLDDAAIEAIANEIKGVEAKKDEKIQKVETPVETPVKKVTVVTTTIATEVSNIVSTESEKELGLRKTDIYTEGAETVGDKAKYATAPTGTSTKIERAFTNAPPMVPHDVTGMLPITIKSNQCITCHDKANAEGMKASMPNLTAIPASHYKDLRAKDQKDLPKLAGSRFNCSQCHAPQSDTKPLVKNTFQADFQSDAEKRGSNLADTINIGKDIIK